MATTDAMSKLGSGRQQEASRSRGRDTFFWHDTIRRGGRRKLLKTLPERLAKVSTLSVCDTLGDVLFNIRVETPAHSLAEAEAETSGDRLPDVATEALVHTLVNSLEKVDVKTHRH